MEATNLHALCSSIAPREWWMLPEIANAKPKDRNTEISLQRLDDTNICVWMIRKSVWWMPVGDFFIVKP